MKKLILLLALLPSLAFAWDGYDYQTGDYVSIDRGNLVRPGLEIEFYDYNTGEYRYGDVEGMNDLGGSVEVEVYDHTTEQRRYLEMEK